MKDFLSQSPSPITKAKDLAEKLSKPTIEIKDGILDILKNKEDINRRIEDVFEAFKNLISKEINEDTFADAFAQTFTYSLFLTKITLNASDKITLYNIDKITPKSFNLIKDILYVIREIDDYPSLKPYVDYLIHITNYIDKEAVIKDLQTNKEESFVDPYIYFYEDFFEAYHKKKKTDLGVFYTPKPIVKSIIDNIDKILKQDFGLKDGFSDKSIKVLDFACGTGTFLFEVYDKILSKLDKTSLKRKSLIKDHILKNIFGFELLIPAYCIAHLKLSQHLKEEGYELKEDDRIQVLYTNTLENKLAAEDNHLLFKTYEEIIKESKKAQEIKDSNDILVITGNPPYSGESQNDFKYIKDLIKPYFPNDKIKEKNPKWLNDDYVKFIRFSENKIASAGKGVVGIITNHGFIDNPTFRAMRKHLMDTFDKIYIVDLHGNAKKKEKSPDGSSDENVFDIEQGVCISFFIKNDKIKEKGVYHLDIYGKREEKFEEILEVDIEKKSFEKVNPTKPFYLFIPQNEVLRYEYEKGISLRDIFLEKNTGIITKRDKMAFKFNKEEIKNVIKDVYNLSHEKIKEKYNKIGWESRDGKIEFCKQDVMNNGLEEKLFMKCNYRPFDERWTYYTGNSKGFMGWPVYDIMQHFIDRENVGLVFVRQSQALGSKDSDNLCFISNKLIDLNMYRRGGACISPLYLYKDNDKKGPNFQAKFLEFINEKFNNPTPEEILAFIYSSLHSPTYRKKYLEFLKIDFPRVNFDVSLEKFKSFSKIGQDLIDAHLMNKIPDLSIGEAKI